MKKRALVVGAAGGVGREVVSILLAQGYAVVVSVMDDAQRADLLVQFPTIEKTFVVRLDHADNLITAINDALGDDAPLHAVAMCAGIAPFGPVETAPLSALRNIFEINTLANVAVFQATIERLRRTRGRIVFISSVAGRVSFPFVGYYSASKYALEALADAMRREVKKFGVRVSLVEPGGIRTPMATDILEAVTKDCTELSGRNKELYADLFEAHRDSVASIGQSGMPPREVADAIWSALSEETPKARYVVGADAVHFSKLERTLSDEELDALATIAETTTIISEGDK